MAADPYAIDLPVEAKPDPYAVDLPTGKAVIDPYSGDLSTTADPYAEDLVADGKPPMDRMSEGLASQVQRMDDLDGTPYVGDLPALADVGKAFLRMITGTAKLPGTVAEIWHEKATGEFEESASAGAIRDIEEKYLKIVPKEHWYEQLPEGFGAALGFMTGGVFGKIAGLGVKTTAAGLGASVAGTGGYEEAIALGGDPDEAAISFFANAALGTTEALPTALFLKQLNKVTGGKTAELIRRYGKTNPGAVWQGVKGMMTEAGQEGFQTWGSNWIASDIAKYDPARTLGENFWNNVFTGGTVGMALGGTMGFIESSQRRKALADLAIEHGEAVASDPINTIEGIFTPVDGIVKLYEVGEEMRGIMRVRAAEATKIKEDEFGVPVSPLAGLEDAANQKLEPSLVKGRTTQGPTDPSVPAKNSGYWLEFEGQAVDPVVEKALPAGTKVEEALKTQPVVAMNTTLYTQELEAAQEAVKFSEDMLAKQQKSGNAQTIAASQHNLTVTKEAETAIRVKRNIATSLLKEIKSYVAGLREATGLPAKILLVDAPGFTTQAIVDNQKAAGYLSAVSEVPGAGQVDIMFIRLEKMTQEIYNAKSVGASTQAMETQKRRFFGTINHEFGHSIFSNIFIGLLKTARTGTPQQAQEAYETYNFIEAEYRQWLKRIAQDGTLALLHTTKMDPQVAMDFNTGKSKDKRLTDKNTGYAVSIDEFFADYTARLAAQGALPNSTLTKFFQPVMEQYKAMFEKFPQYAQNEYGGNWLTYLKSLTIEAKIKKAIEIAEAGGGHGKLDAIMGKVPGFDPKKFAGERGYLDMPMSASGKDFIKGIFTWHQEHRFKRGLSLGLNLLQMVKENQHIKHWRLYLQAVFQWQTYQRAMTVRASDALTMWKALGTSEASQLSNVFLEEQDLGRRLNPRELSAKLTGEGVEAYIEVRKVFDFILSEMETLAIADANATYEPGSAIQKAEVEAVTKEFAKMREKGYFPAIRFGKYTLEARATETLTYKGETYNKGDLITFPTFETEHERNQVLEILRHEFRGKATVSPSVMREDEFAIQGMPRSLLRTLKKKLQLDNNLSKDQAEAFDKELENLAPFRNFRKQFMRKKGVHGASEDMIRSFAYYTRSSAGHIARLKYSEDMRTAIKAMQESVVILQRTGDLAQNRQLMVQWMNRHFDYIMNPAEEWAALRGAAFVAYLGMNIKSAMINGLQITQVAYPYLAARYRDDRAVAALMKAPLTLQSWMLNKTAYIDALEDDQGVVKKPDEKKARYAKMIAAGQSEGWLDQSMATEWAIAASENNLDRGLHLPAGKRFWHNFSRYSAMPFHLVEKMNRYVVASASYELEFNKTGDHNKSVLAAREAVWTTQYESARWNRPEFLRGKKAVLLLFMNYVQHTLFFAIRDPGRRRWWMMMFLMAGVMGFPGADDLEDLIDATATKLNRMLGIKNPKFQLRVELREALEELRANPDLILHGLSQSSFGMAHVGELTGIPIPSFDVSQSVGMGNIIPGTEIPGTLMQNDPNRAAVQAAAELAGAGGNLVEQFYSGLFSNDPDDWKRAEKVLPMMSLRNISKMARYFVRGEETTADGQIVAKFDPHDMRDTLSIIGQGLGFTPTKVTKGWEKIIVTKDAITYYQVQSAALQKQINWAFFNEDRESYSDMLDEIRKYNAQVPFPEMQMTQERVRNGIREYVNDHIKAGMGAAGDRKSQRLRRKLEEAYPDPAGDRMSKDPSAEF